MPDKISAPVPRLGVLGPEEAEAAVRFCIYKAAIEIDALGDGCFHFRHGEGPFRIDVGG